MVRAPLWSPTGSEKQPREFHGEGSNWDALARTTACNFPTGSWVQRCSWVVCTELAGVCYPPTTRPPSCWLSTCPWLTTCSLNGDWQYLHGILPSRSGNSSATYHPLSHYPPTSVSLPTQSSQDSQKSSLLGIQGFKTKIRTALSWTQIRGSGNLLLQD